MRIETTILRYISFAVAVLWAACSPAMAESVRIHGRITDGDNRAMEFVTVRVAGTAIGTMSGLDGDYSLSTAEADTITVVFTCIGYKEQQRKLVDAKGDVTLNMRMFRTVKELQEVEVSEVKKQIGAMQSVDVSAYRRGGIPSTAYHLGTAGGTQHHQS